MTFLAAWHRYLDSLYPGLWNATVALVVVFLVWLLKKVRPDLFAKLPPAVQALPAVVLSAFVGGLSSLEPTIAGIITQVVGGGLIGGATAVGAHHMLKESPLPYGNPPKAPPSSKVSNGLIVAVFLSVLWTVAFYALFVFQACSPQQVASAVQIADDVEQIAKVLCLHDHAQRANVRAITVQDLCSTQQQLAPYLPMARHSQPVDLGDAGAP